MGQAKIRGTREDRIAQAVERKRIETEGREFFRREQMRLDQWHLSKLTADARRRNTAEEHRGRMLAAQMVGLYASLDTPYRMLRQLGRGN